MNKILKMIVNEKQKEVLNLNANPFYLSKYKEIINGKYSAGKKSFFRNALIKTKRSVIAEVKRKSPSKSKIANIPDPSLLAKKYVSGGASAISVLTDREFFSGSLNDLSEVKKNLDKINCPVLRKDFIIDPIQIVETIDAGADAILLIVAALGKDKTKALLDFSKAAEIDAMVEVHSNDELDIAISAGAQIIGINNRNLDTFEIDVNISKSMISGIPDNIVKVSESGIRSSEMARELFRCGFNAVLVGEFLASADDPSNLIKEMLL